MLEIVCEGLSGRQLRSIDLSDNALGEKVRLVRPCGSVCACMHACMHACVGGRMCTPDPTTDGLLLPFVGLVVGGCVHHIHTPGCLPLP